MYIIMYKYSALKINRKSFPNNIKNPIAPAQRKQSPPSPSSPVRPWISQSKTPCCHQTAWGLPLIIQQAVIPLTLDIIDLLYINHTRLCGSE